MPLNRRSARGKQNISVYNNTVVKDFEFKPACGKRISPTKVTVSGMIFEESEIDEYGKGYAELMLVTDAIDDFIEEKG